MIARRKWASAGGQDNAGAKHSRPALMASAHTVTRYVDLPADLLLVRRLRPYHRNTGKPVVKAPKVYIRDSGLVHALLSIPDYNALSAKS